MSRAEHRIENASPWLSISGEERQALPDNGFLGKCSDIARYERLNQLGEGTYGVVFRAKDHETSSIVALKQIRIDESERHNGIPITALREISILKSLKHQNIVNVLDVAADAHLLEEIFMVMEYCEQDMANLLDELNVKFSLSQVKCLFKQVLEGIEYLHKNDIIHRDVKMQNLLLTSKGVLKLADFGMAREFSSRPLTPGVVTIWYRAPELLLGTKYYTQSVDIWSLGLILAELILSEACLMGTTPIEQLALTVKLLGSPFHDDIAALSAMGCPDLVKWRRDDLTTGRPQNLERRFLSQTSLETPKFLLGLLKWNPASRWTASEALGHGGNRYAEAAKQWWNESPRAASRDLLPTFPEVRNGITVGVADINRDSSGLIDTQRSEPAVAGGSGSEHGYVFDFQDKGSLRRPNKRHRRL